MKLHPVQCTKYMHTNIVMSYSKKKQLNTIMWKSGRAKTLGKKTFIQPMERKLCTECFPKIYLVDSKKWQNI